MQFYDDEDRDAVFAAVEALKKAGLALAGLNFRSDEVLRLLSVALESPHATTREILDQ